MALHLVEKAQSLLQSSMAASTQGTYRKTWARFQGFKLEIFGSSSDLPVPPYRIVLYISHLALLGYSPATVSTQLSALSYLHKLSNAPDPTDTFLVRKVMRGFKNTSPPPNMRLPITPALLYQLIAALPPCLHPNIK